MFFLSTVITVDRVEKKKLKEFRNLLQGKGEKSPGEEERGGGLIKTPAPSLARHTTTTLPYLFFHQPSLFIFLAVRSLFFFFPHTSAHLSLGDIMGKCQMQCFMLLSHIELLPEP